MDGVIRCLHLSDHLLGSFLLTLSGHRQGLGRQDLDLPDGLSGVPTDDAIMLWGRVPMAF